VKEDIEELRQFLVDLEAETDTLCDTHSEGFKCSTECQKVKSMLKMVLKEEPNQRASINDLKKCIHK
jgi:hypothetical protein